MKWRKVKKQFKKNKHKYIGWNMEAEAKDGSVILGAISDVRISPAGGKEVNYKFFATPTEVKKPEPKEEPHYYSHHGFSASFDMRLENPTKEIMSLLKS